MRFSIHLLTTITMLAMSASAVFIPGAPTIAEEVVSNSAATLNQKKWEPWQEETKLIETLHTQMCSLHQEYRDALRNEKARKLEALRTQCLVNLSVLEDYIQTYPNEWIAETYYQEAMLIWLQKPYDILSKKADPIHDAMVTGLRNVLTAQDVEKFEPWLSHLANWVVAAEIGAVRNATARDKPLIQDIHEELTSYIMTVLEKLEPGQSLDAQDVLQPFINAFRV